MKRYIYKLKKGIFQGLGFAIGLGTVALLSVSVTLNTFSPRTPINASQVNQNFANLKMAVESVVPVGTIWSYASSDIPAGWLLCDGASLTRTTYPALFAKIGTAYGSSDSNSFNLPDLRGRFLRGTDNSPVGFAVDPDRDTRISLYTGGNTGKNLGSYQGDELKSHTHGFYNHQLGPGGSNSWSWFSPNAGYGFQTGAYGGNETRPKNVYVNFIIKY